MHAHHCAGALAIDVQVADVETAPSLINPLPVPTEERAGKAVVGRIRDLKCVREVPSAYERDHGSEDLLLCDSRVRRNVGEDSRLDEAVAFSPAAQQQLPFTLAGFDVAKDLLVRRRIDDRSDRS